MTTARETDLHSSILSFRTMRELTVVMAFMRLLPSQVTFVLVFIAKTQWFPKWIGSNVSTFLLFWDLLFVSNERNKKLFHIPLESHSLSILEHYHGRYILKGVPFHSYPSIYNSQRPFTYAKSTTPLPSPNHTWKERILLPLPFPSKALHTIPPSITTHYSLFLFRPTCQTE